MKTFRVLERLSMQSKINAVQNGTETPVIFREVKIGDTIYRLTSRFEGDKDLDATLRCLAVKRVTNFREEENSDQNH